MNAVVVILMILSSVFHDVGKSREGVLRASINPWGENYILKLESTNQKEAEEITLNTTNSWTINLSQVLIEKEDKGVFIINPIQRSVLLEEEILSFDLHTEGITYKYVATDRSFFKNRLK